ncbi:MAG: pyridoxamine 5'-phosphate oxidase family protein [Acidimicrobiia bacterium]
MANHEPATDVDSRFSMEGAKPTSWNDAQHQLTNAELYWLTSVRPNGRPHVTPLISVWLDGALHFCTGPSERKAKNLARNAHCILTTGTNSLNEGLDLVIEGDAQRVRDDGRLRTIAGAYEAKYGPDWHFDVHDGMFHHDSGEALVFSVTPTKAFGLGKGAYSQTRWVFDLAS